MEVKGILEIDVERGVIYFHPTEGPMMGRTLLRICRLPLISIDLDQKLIDITHMKGVTIS